MTPFHLFRLAWVPFFFCPMYSCNQLLNVAFRARTVGGIERLPDGRINYAEDFFAKPSYLTVSGQMNAEYYACALSNVYTFGPTFRCAHLPLKRRLAPVLDIFMILCMFSLQRTQLLP